MYKIGVLGKKESVICFMSSGFEVCGAENKADALEGLKKLVGIGCAVIFITDEYAHDLSEECEKYKKEPLPAIITIPGVRFAQEAQANFRKLNGVQPK